VQDQESLSARRLGAYLSAIYDLDPDDDRGWPFNGSVLRRAPIVRPALLDLLAVRTLLLRDDTRPPARAVPLERVGRFGRRALWVNPNALPRAYTVTRVRFVADESAALAAISSPDFEGHAEAVVVGAPDAVLHQGARVPFTPAHIAVDQAERVGIDVRVDEPSLLVLADAFAPGWRAHVDGESRPLWQVNHLVRGVAVGPGDRRVEFSYRPPGLLLGLTVAVLSWIAVLAIVARARRHVTSRPGGG
jgi:hypothetical protein